MKFLGICCFLILSSFFCRAQEYSHDVLLYSGIQIKKDLPKGFDISAKYQLRLDNNLSHLKGSYIYGTVQYSLIKKYLSAEFEYRYSTSYKKDQHRFSLGLNGKYKFKHFTFSNRVAYQRAHEYFNSGYEKGHEPLNVIRNRLQIKWGFKKRWDAYVSGEPFFAFSNGDSKINRIRTIAGMDWEFKKHHTINLYYLFQQELFEKNPEIEYAIGIEYEWDIPKFKKKKKQ